MTKQEFLAMSLQHKLKVYVKYSHKPDNSELETMIGIVDDCIITDMHEEDMAPLSISNYGLCLRPLSDLTKEIEHKGEKFVPIIELIKIKYSILLDLQDEDFSIYTDGYPRACYTTNAIWEIMINPYYLPNEEFWIIQKLIEWHFNLMDIGEEFIDVNTLEENPYK